MAYQVPLEQVNEFTYRIPKSYQPGMLVDGLIYSSQKLIESVKKDRAPEQVVNVAHLPGIVKYSLAMPDIHWGYGFPIGGVAATDPDNGGVISPGGVGFDINCGVRLLKTNLSLEDLKDKISKIVNLLFEDVPSGIGSKGNIRVSRSEEERLLVNGARWAVKRGFGVDNDLECCEENGAIEGADPDSVSDKAYKRGKPQAGTLGSGNHFLEVQVIEEIFDQAIAQEMGL